MGQNNIEAWKSRSYFLPVFTELLASWEAGQIELMGRFRESTMDYMQEMGILERRSGSTIMVFTEKVRRRLAETMIDFLFPVDGTAAREPEQPRVTPEVVEVKLKRNEDPGYSLRAILAACRIIRRKLEESPRVLEDLNDGNEPPVYTAIKVTKILPTFIAMDEGLFLLPEYAFLEGGGVWQTHGRPEEIQEFRVLLQA